MFGFGRKRREQAAQEAAQDTATNEESTERSVVKAASAGAADDAVAANGAEYGPWDINDAKAPDIGSYLDLGAYLVPHEPDIELQVKTNPTTGAVLGATITYRDASMEVEAFAAPKTQGLWDDIRAELLEAHSDAHEQNGIFGTEIILPVTLSVGKLAGKQVATRIVGVDGFRWMLRAVFSGSAVDDGETASVLSRVLQGIIVRRGEEPLAPRDLIPMSLPALGNADTAAHDATESTADDALSDPNAPQVPLQSMQQVESETTLTRGPLFTEMR